MNILVEEKIISSLFSLSDPKNGAKVEISIDEKNKELQIIRHPTEQKVAFVHSISIDNFMNMPIEIFCNLCRSIEKDAENAA